VKVVSVEGVDPKLGRATELTVKLTVTVCGELEAEV
jgi:hypothetical protein